jgi:hypothetical protein
MVKIALITPARIVSYYTDPDEAGVQIKPKNHSRIDGHYTLIEELGADLIWKCSFFSSSKNDGHVLFIATMKQQQFPGCSWLGAGNHSRALF